MIDYLAHLAALDALLDEWGAPGANAELSARLRPPAVDHRAQAALGALVDHLVWHTSSDGTELQHLREASDAWRRGLDVYARVATARQQLEAAFLAPGEVAAPAQFAAGYAALAALQHDVDDVVAVATALRAQLGSLPHLKADHPRQASAVIADWGAADRFLARRTAAFARDVVRAAGDEETAAFAGGVVASYVGNVVGSSYLGAVVGGPRRSHRFRDRLARNAVGTWVGGHRPVPSFTELADVVSFGAPDLASAALPAGVRAATEAALASAYPAMPPAGDLDVGLRRLIEHLRLLDTFRVPDLPAPLPAVLGATVTLTVAPNGSPGEGVQPQGTDDFGNGGPAPTSSTTTTTTSDKSSASGDACIAVLAAAIVFALVFVVDCIVQLADHGECDPGETWKKIKDGGDDEPPEQVEVSGQFLTAAAADGRGAHLVQHLVDLQAKLWQGFDVARTFLATVGLIYPDADQLASPLFGQFVTTPALGPNDWPRREEHAPLDTYTDYPAGAVEQPARFVNFAGGHAPDAFLDAVGPASREGLAHFLDEPVNLDLDADRGWLHPCWGLAPDGHIDDQPLPVTLLGPGEL